MPWDEERLCIEAAWKPRRRSLGFAFQKRKCRVCVEEKKKSLLALATSLPFSLKPSLCLVLPHVATSLSISYCQKVCDGRMWSHTSSDIFNHTKKKFLSPFFLVPRRRRPPEKSDTQMRSFNFYHSFSSELCQTAPDSYCGRRLFIGLLVLLRSSTFIQYTLFDTFPHVFLAPRTPAWGWRFGYRGGVGN